MMMNIMIKKVIKKKGKGNRKEMKVMLEIHLQLDMLHFINKDNNNNNK